MRQATLIGLAVLIIAVVPSAEAAHIWIPGVKWCSNPKLWNTISDPVLSRAHEIGISVWNAGPQGRDLARGSDSSYDVYVGQYWDNDGSLGRVKPDETGIDNNGDGCFDSGDLWLEYNTYGPDPSIELAVHIATHEIGHVLNLDDHYSSEGHILDLMTTDSMDNFDRGMYFQTYDAINGVGNGLVRGLS